MHQGAALVGGELGPLAGAQTQNVLQKVAVAAGVVFFQLAGRDAQPPPQQQLQSVEVPHLPGGAARHAVQKAQALGLVAFRGVKGFGKAGALGVRQGPAAAQAVEAVGGGGRQIGKFQLRGRRAQPLHDGFQRGAEGQALPLGPAHPQPLGRGREGLVEADLLAHHAVFKAVGQVDFVCHEGVAVGVGQQARLARGGGELAFRQPQHKDVIGCVEPHLACAGQHHGVQRLGDVAQIGRAQQQAKQVFVLRHGDGLLSQQAGHLVEQAHDHVPLPGGFLSGGDAPGGPDGLHLRGLLFLRAQLFQAEVERPAHLLGVGVPQFRPQGLHGPHQQGPGFFGPLQVIGVLFGGHDIAETLRVFGKFCPPRRRVGRPGVGVVFEGADFFFTQRAKARFGQRRQIFSQISSPRQRQQGPHGGGWGAELRGGGLVAVKRDVRHAELVPQCGAVLGDIAADHSHFAAAHTLPHQAADGPRHGPGFLFPAGGSIKGQALRFLGQNIAAARFQQLSHRCQRRGVFVAQVPAQQLRRRHLGPVFAGQLAQLRRHLLRAREEPQIPRGQRRTVVAQGHRHRGQAGKQSPQQPLFGRVEGIEFVDEDGPPLQKGGHPSFGEGTFQPGRCQFQPVGWVHAGVGEQGLIPLENHCQLAELAALGPAVLGQGVQLLAGKPGALELVDGLGGHLAEGRTAAVAVVVMDVVLQLFQRAADEHGPARIRQGLDGRAALAGQDLLGQTREGKALHKAGARIPQLAVDAPLGGGGELFRHQQDALFPCRRAGPDALVQQGGLAAAGAA